MDWYRIYDKIRKYIILWIVLIVILLVASIAVYGGEIVTAVRSSFMTAVGSIIECGIIIGVLIFLFRSLFR